MTKQARVGRGLASLIPDSALDGTPTSPNAPATEREGIRTVPVDELRPNPEQPRKLFDKEELDELAGSIKVHGILSPLIVRRHDGRYIVIAGERRLRAATQAGLSEVPVIVREASDTSLQLELALVENLQRTDLNPIEAARGFEKLIHKHGYTQEQVASAVGKNRATIANAVRLLNLPEFAIEAIEQGKISAGHGRALLQLADDEGEIRRLLQKTVDQQLNVRQVERLATARPTPVAESEASPGKERAMEYAEKLLTEALHTNVAITPKRKGGGRILIDYADRDELERLIGTLRGTAVEVA